MNLVGTIMVGQATTLVIGLADVEVTGGIFQNVNMKHEKAFGLNCVP